MLRSLYMCRFNSLCAKPVTSLSTSRRLAIHAVGVEVVTGAVDLAQVLALAPARAQVLVGELPHHPPHRGGWGVLPSPCDKRRST